MLLAELAAASAEVASSSSRLAKIRRLAAALRAAGPEESAIAVAWLSGELPQRQIGVGWAALRSLPPAGETATLTVRDVDARFSAVKATSGAGSQARRAQLLGELFTTATEPEQQFLRRLLGGELRQGALAGVMADAVAQAADVPLADVRRAAMLTGDLPYTAALAVREGVAGLAAVRLRVGRPVSPMLAQSAADVGDALAKLGGEAILDTKLDGARVQLHRDGTDVSIFTRSLDDVTARLPELVAAARALPVRTLVADGEVLALRPDGRPQPFQVTASRFGRRTASQGGDVPLAAFFFDLLHVDGEDLLGLGTAERLARLDAILPAQMRVARVRTSEPAAAETFLRETLRRGHEGLVAKAPDATYEAGRRGRGWVKVKPVHTLDLVVLAVEWGSGRRRGTLSNIHLGALDPVNGGFVMLGKTFKGMTDDMLAWQTQRFLALADGPTDGYVVTLRPEQVVEVAFDGIQRSSRYPGGVALRFARVVRYRDDKAPQDADTIEAVRAYAT
jgi:DNA ligase 1